MSDPGRCVGLVPRLGGSRVLSFRLRQLGAYQPAALYIWLSADCEEALIQGRWTLSWALMLGPDADRAATSNFPSHSAPLCGFLVVNKLS
jgi:hypothetical protein